MTARFLTRHSPDLSPRHSPKPFTPSFPRLHPVIPAPSHPVIPAPSPRHSRESGNPEGCGRHWDARERLMSTRAMLEWTGAAALPNLFAPSRLCAIASNFGLPQRLNPRHNIGIVPASPKIGVFENAAQRGDVRSDASDSTLRQRLVHQRDCVRPRLAPCD